MANHQSAKKRIRSNEKRRIRNKATMSKLNTITSKVLSTDDKVKAEEILKDAVSAIDKTASKGVIHKNNAARRKSALSTHVNKLAAKAE